MIFAATHRLGFHLHCLDCSADLTPALSEPLLHKALKHEDLLCELTTEHGGRRFYKAGQHNTSPRCATSN